MNKHAFVENRPCEYCTTMFRAIGDQWANIAKYCSERCRMAAIRKRQKKFDRNRRRKTGATA